MSGEKSHRPTSEKSLMIAALGVVYGDIGTSPLYAFRQSILAAGGPSHDNVTAVLSMIIWALILVVTVKYVVIILRANHHGEGGTIALTSLALSQVKSRMGYWTVLTAGLVGIALFYGDSIITPAISVLSAVEGIDLAYPTLDRFIIPIAIGLIAILFAIERHGTAVIGRLFGPIMLLWFVTLGVLGLLSLLRNLAVLEALNPLLAVAFFASHPGIAFIVLGAVVLAVTGGEALYADMGHFGIRAVRKTWGLVVFPALVLNYLGQGAMVLQRPAAIENPFYLLAPDWLLPGMIVLAAAATIIASQAVISGAFSITNQAIQLGYIPRIRVRHTSAEEIGQIYVSQVNLFLLVAVELLVLSFRSSENLAAAYGIAVTGSMAIDTSLAYFFLVRARGWSKLLAIPLFGLLLSIDTLFFSSNLLKFFDGGWFPIAVAGIILALMLAWITGRERLLEARRRDAVPIHDFLASLGTEQPIRVPGTVVFMVPNTRHVPASLARNIRHNRVIHERVILMTVATQPVPYVADDQRLTITSLPENFYIVELHYGYFEEPRILRALAQLRTMGMPLKLTEISFFVGREKLTSAAKTVWQHLADRTFILLHRNMLAATEYFKIPPDHVVELGGHIEISRPN